MVALIYQSFFINVSLISVVPNVPPLNAAKGEPLKGGNALALLRLAACWLQLDLYFTSMKYSIQI